MFHMDDKDWKIIDELRRDCSQTVRSIAKRTNIPITTVHKRIKKLKDEGIITGSTVELNYSKLGKGLSVILLIKAAFERLIQLNKNQHDCMRDLRSLPEVQSAYLVTGGTDFVVRIRVKDVHEYDKWLLTRLHKLGWIGQTESLIIIHGD